MSNRIFKTALPPDCPYVTAAAIVERMKGYLKDRFERSLPEMKKRIGYERPLSPTTSDRSGHDDDFDTHMMYPAEGIDVGI